MIFRMRREVRAQVIDAIRKDCDLHTGGARVTFGGLILLNRRCFFECHVVYSPRVRPSLVR